MRILLYCSAFNSLTQRIYCELELLNHEVCVLMPCMWQSTGLTTEDEKIRQLVDAVSPELIICPFLKHRIPTCVCEKYICLVVHPGEIGDRGPSALDWCIFKRFKQWGVTLLQATQELDGGPIWGHRTFDTRETSKSSLYRHEVSRRATELITQVLIDLSKGKTITKCASPVKSIWRPYLKHVQRAIDWQHMNTEQICNRIRSADSQPGLKTELENQTVFLYGANADINHGGTPGTIIALDQQAICIATIDGAVWIQQIRRDTSDSLKLPASYFLQRCGYDTISKLKPIINPERDINTQVVGDVAYINFSCYNGAMDTGYCERLKAELVAVKNASVKVIVLCGGKEFWSNGIHLNVIEASTDPAQESWQNINAMNNLVEEIINTHQQITVAAISANAAAGGAIMALACNRVIVREGVILNPHYANMGLYGSEYWTYLLPRRVGEKTALKLTQECKPMLAAKALELGVVDEIFDGNQQQFHQTLTHYCAALSEPKNHRDITAYYSLERQKHQKSKPLHRYREEELTIMRCQFFDPDSDYHLRRRAFVQKAPSPLAKGIQTAGQLVVSKPDSLVSVVPSDLN